MMETMRVEKKILNIVDGKIITSSNQYSINLLNKDDDYFKTTNTTSFRFVG